MKCPNKTSYTTTHVEIIFQLRLQSQDRKKLQVGWSHLRFFF